MEAIAPSREEGGDTGEDEGLEAETSDVAAERGERRAAETGESTGEERSDLVVFGVRERREEGRAGEETEEHGERVDKGGSGSEGGTETWGGGRGQEEEGQ